MFSRVLVANRGEVAVRVIRALHENDVEAVAVYSTVDRDSLHVRLADRAVCIGPPQATESYPKIPSVIAAATTTGCEAVHPGWGFLAENPAFVEACADNDLVFIGPSAEVMARMGDKVRAKAELKAAGVPLVPGTEGATDLDESREAAEEVGYPVLLKATAGGGGKGMRLVRAPRRARFGLQHRRRSRPRRPSATAASTSRRRSRRRGTSRSRCSPTARAASSPSASASARSSGATRS